MASYDIRPGNGEGPFLFQCFINTKKPPVEATLVVTYLQFPFRSAACAAPAPCSDYALRAAPDRPSPTLLPLPTLGC